jgi:endo-1,4-beta-xylanase
MDSQREDSMMQRRDFVRTAAAAAAASRLGWLHAVLDAQATLKSAAASKGILYGSAAPGPMLQDQQYQQLFMKECAIITPESELKMGTVFQGPTTYNFGPGDALLQFAQSNGIKMRGHTLAFWQSIPGWLPRAANPQNARDILTKYIQTVCGHYAGKLQSWDVVNEAIAPEDHNPDGIRNSLWQSTIGEDYIPLAFTTARQADPTALLVYNDYGIEYSFPGIDARRTAILNLITKLKSQNVPIQAFGLQAHLYGSSVQKMDTQGIASFLKSISDMGLKILITELDVQDKGLPADPNARDQALAQSYTKFLGTVLQNTNVIVVETWGLADKYSWLQNHAPRDDGQAVRSLPYDSAYQPKSAVYQAMVQAFNAAPPRTV